MDVIRLADGDRQQWDAYVAGSPYSTFFHLAGWAQVWQAALGSRTHYLLATDGDRVAGTLPLIHVKSRLSGHFLTSLPGGLCADDEAAAAALLDQARELLHETGARYLILRDGLHRWELPGLVTNEDHCTFHVDLSGGLEEARANLRRSTRKLSKRGLRAGVRAVPDQGALDTFYPVYARAMRERGTPTPGRSFFHTAMQRFSERLVLLTIRRQGEMLGGGFIAPFKDTIFCTWSGMPRAHYDLYTSYLLYWGVIDYGCEHGLQKMDMGRCRRGSGSYAFKAGWGGEMQPLYQQYLLNGIERPPKVGGSLQEEAKYRLFFNVWQRLPLPLTEWLGPQLRKRMPFG